MAASGVKIAGGAIDVSPVAITQPISRPLQTAPLSSAARVRTDRLRVRCTARLVTIPLSSAGRMETK